MHLRAHGPQDASTTFVLLHGFPGGAADWRGVAERLVLAGARVLIPDLLGFGASPRPTSFEKLWTGAQAEALAAELDDLAVRAAVVVGHDYGGPVAITLTDRRPDLVGALAVVDTNVFGDTPIGMPLSLVLVPGIGRIAERVLFSASFLRMLAGRLTVTAGTTVHANDADEATSIRILFAGVLRNVAGLYGPIEKAAGRVSVPSLVVWGSGDPLFPVEQGERTADLLHARLEVLDGVGHLPPAEAPDRVAELLQSLRAETT
jgi:pimeloyl-ACP methyl ester carboxylesterase